ncbi:putative fatty acyl-CoA reductase CG5065 [Fopius arisanus]|uniref:Fatty acyl-CoA reductase n=1 Tax=Fopius arisanus TaxID=64838 RepID=A0A9R1U5K9_9HYME|nr:PREDICTED: putative fatty acyl-CoA reductase CG5065 [Fopius arisanus]XP_011307906.1 PREDICTED: putative fatty acyl-CoA reductase CG5065 [Fopius arisanus]
MCAEALSVVNFYEEKSILITGATGGIGKLLIEKLLRSCPNIGKIYVLLRSKRGESATQRINNLVNTPIFHKLRGSDPGILSKVVMIEGDLCQPDLGISETNREELMKNVSVVFHCAAILQFDLSLEDALSINVFGTRRLLLLCYRMTKIEAFVHVSTLYSTCNQSKIEECIPSIPVLNGRLDFNKSVREFVMEIPEDVVKDWPNTYSFSKALAEIMLNAHKGTLPISIVRPSIVLATLREPMPGWIDNFYGPTLSISNGALGILRSVICDGEKIGDIIPSDLVVNLLVTVGCKTKYQGTSVIKVYNSCTGRQNPMRMKQLLDDCQKYSRMYPLMKAVRYPNLTYRSSYLVHWIVSKFQHRLLSYILDFVALFTSKKGRMIRIHNTLSRILATLDYFTLRQWAVDDCNVQRLINEMSEKEKDLFYFDPKIIDWKLYVKIYSLGIRRHLFKESMDDIEEAKARMANLYWMERSLQLFMSVASVMTVYYWIKSRSSRHQ